MSAAKTVSVQILDKEYCIACPPEAQQNLQQAAQYLDRKMREIRASGKLIGADRIAVMAGLNITHELLQKQSQQEQHTKQTHKTLHGLLERANTVLADEPSDDLFDPRA